MSDINERYKQLNNSDIAKVLNVKISAYSPQLTDTDYQRGYITRFFVQRVNDKAGPIFEVANKDFGALVSNSLYNTTSLRWRITGPKQPTYNPKTGEVLDIGVYESNKKSIELASTTMPNLKLYLPNTIQYWKDS